MKTSFSALFDTKIYKSINGFHETKGITKRNICNETIYQAFHALGTVECTISLLTFISDVKLREIIHRSTNKNEVSAIQASAIRSYEEGLCSGRVNQNVDPTPCSLSTPTCPWCCSMSMRHTYNPSPSPVFLLLLSWLLVPR